MAFNPCEMLIKMKLVETNDGNGAYYIGNCNMDVNLKDTVIKLIEPRDGVRETTLVVKLENKNRPKFPHPRNEEPEEYNDEE